MTDRRDEDACQPSRGAGIHPWRPFVDALDPRLTTICFDAPGVGASSPSRVPLPYQAIAEIAVRLVRQLGRERFDVLGISWGGGLAQQISFQHPRACRRLVLAATATGAVILPGSPRVLRHVVTPGRYRDPEYARRVAVPVVNARVMARLLPHARLHTYDDGHLALLTSAATLAPVVSQFLLED